jgi:hypothetical protein
MTDLILSVVKDRRWSDIDCYALSLSRSGYSGKKVMLVEEVPEDAQSNLRELGFEVIPFITPASLQYLHFQTSRYFQAIQYLRQHTELRYVIWTDVVDLVFQSDPIVWMDNNFGYCDILAAKEGWLIKNQDINDYWIRRLVDDQEYTRIRELEVLCSGSIFGRANAILVLFEAMWQMFGQSDMQGIDQGVFNVLLSKAPFKDISRAPDPEEGLICTCGPFLAPSDPNSWTIKPPVFNHATGLVSTESGKTFSVVHQYNRHHGVFDPDGAWRNILEQRYRN